MCIRKGVYAREMKRVLWKEFFVSFVKKIYILLFFSLINFFSFSFLLRFLPFIEIFKIREVQVKE